MKTVAVIIARMGSSRLPGKVLMDLAGEPVLHWVVRAAREAPGVDQVVVATSTLEPDNAIKRWCLGQDIVCYRGSESDVLSRVLGAAQMVKADFVVRITGDCPLIDSTVIGEVIRRRHVTGAHYCSNIDPPTYPDGLDCECFSIEALSAADYEAHRPIDRECVTTWISRNQSRFKAETVVCPVPGLHKERWVLDTENDYQFCQAVAEKVIGRTIMVCPPSYLEILQILDANPKIREINQHHPRNERFYAALGNEPLTERRFPRSKAALGRALDVIPFGAQTFSKSHVQFPGDAPLFLSHGDGGRCYDIDGNEYVDLVNALLPNILGYRDPDVDEAVRSQLSKGISFSLATELEADLAERLVRLIPCAEMVKFGKNGTDVTTAAVRAARAFTGRNHVALTGYAGWADWSMTERKLGIPNVVSELSHKLKPLDSEAAEDYFRTWGHSTAAIVVEMENLTTEYLRLLRNLCTRYGVLLVFDEVISGFRYSLGGAQTFYGVTPDLGCFAKAMGNGMPIGALVGRRDIMLKFQPPDNLFYSGTFYGETLSIAAAIATIDKIAREPVIPHLWNTGAKLEMAVTGTVMGMNLQDTVILKGNSVRTLIDFNDHETATKEQLKALFIREMVQSGILVINSHNVCYAHSESDMKRVLRAYGHTLEVIKDTLERGDIAKRIPGNGISKMANVRSA